MTGRTKAASAVPLWISKNLALNNMQTPQAYELKTLSTSDPALPPGLTFPSPVYIPGARTVSESRRDQYYQHCPTIQSALIWRVRRCYFLIGLGTMVETRVNGYRISGNVTQYLGRDGQEAIYWVDITSWPELTGGPLTIFLLIPIQDAQLLVFDKYHFLTGSHHAEDEVRKGIEGFPQGRFARSRLIHRVRQTLLTNPPRHSQSTQSLPVLEAEGVYVQIEHQPFWGGLTESGDRMWPRIIFWMWFWIHWLFRPLV